MSLYRPYFTPQEIRMLDATQPTDLSSEINLLRVLIARVLAARQRLHELALAQHAALLATFSAAGLVLAALVRQQCKLHPDLGIRSQIEEGEELARQRRHVYEYLSPLSA